jgi:PAS domain S-box-containing protein
MCHGHKRPLIHAKIVFMNNTSQNFSYFKGTGEVRSLLRRLDWSACSIGPPEIWPEQLHTVLGLILQARSPAAVIWGPDFTTLYNDAYARQLGDKHPAVLGKSFRLMWSEIWPEISSIVDDAMAGKASYFEDVPYIVQPTGVPTQRWYTSSFSPVLDSEGTVAGIYITAIETTDRMRAEQRYAFQADLTDRLRPLLAPNEITSVASELLGQRLNMARVGYVEVDETGEIVTMKPDWTNGDLPSMDGAIWRFDDFGPLISAVLRRGKTLAVNDVAADERSAPYIDAYAANGVRSVLAIPLVKAGRLLAVLQIHQPTAHWWTDLEITLAEDTVERTWAAAERATTEEQKQRAVDALKNFASRQEFQLKLADRLRSLIAPDDIAAAASELLGQHLEISRVLYAEVNDRLGMFAIRHGWLNHGLASIAGEIRLLDDFGPEIIKDLRSGIPMVVDDIALDRRTGKHAEAYAKIDVRSNLAIPLVKAGRLIAILSLQNNEPRHWTKQNIELAHDVVVRTWDAVERAITEAELRAQTEKLLLATDAAKLGLFDHNILTGEINWSDRTYEHVGHPPIAKVNRESFLAHVHPGDREPILKLLTKLYEGTSDGHVDAEYRTLGPDGRQRWIVAKGQMFYDSNAHPTRLVGITMDTTERKQIEQELKEAGRRKDEFLAMLAHELRNPLAPIGAAADLLQLVKLDEARVSQTSEIIGRQVQHMTHLIDDLLDVSRVTRGLIELDNSPLDIRHIVNDAVEQVTPLIQSRQHHLALHLSPEKTMVTGDKKRLVQVIANLLNNAAKYTHAHGNIVLKTEVRAAHILLAVSDDGIGIAPELASRVFDLFAQAERSSDRSSGGLGLGLALVKSLVALHGGSVTCASEGLGRGSRFTVCLPRLFHQDETPELQRSELHLQRTIRPLRVMVVDDNVDAATMLGMLIETAGHQVLVEHDSGRALERARVEAPDVFLLDIGLPQMDGNELARRLRRQPENAHSVMVAVTGYGRKHPVIPS